jgi:hypothetical protein
LPYISINLRLIFLGKVHAMTQMSRVIGGNKFYLYATTLIVRSGRAGISQGLIRQLRMITNYPEIDRFFVIFSDHVLTLAGDVLTLLQHDSNHH